MKTWILIAIAWMFSTQLLAQKSVGIRMDGRDFIFQKNNENAMRIDFTNFGNLFIGKNAGLFTLIDTTSVLGGEQNIFIGDYSGYDNTSGFDNIFLGPFAGNKNVTGYSNIYVGNGAGLNSKTGITNVAVGIISLSNMIVGNQNVALGASAGGKLKNGSNNIFIGNSSGGESTADSLSNNSIYLGTNSGHGLTGDNQLFISHSFSPRPLPLIWGDFDNDSVKVYGTFGIGDAYVLPTSDGSANQYLKTNGNGQAVWSDLTASTADLIADTDNNTKVQVEESPNDNTIRFDINGVEKYVMESNTHGLTSMNVFNNGSNLILGSSPFDLNPTGVQSNEGLRNTCIGIIAGRDLTSGFDNTLIGHGAGLNVTNGRRNVFLGAGSGSGSTSSFFRVTAIGYDSGYGSDADYSTFIGAEAGKNSNGDYNVFIGHLAGLNMVGDSLLAIDVEATTDPLLHGRFGRDELDINGNLTVNINNTAQDILFDTAWTNSSIIEPAILPETDNWGYLGKSGRRFYQIFTNTITANTVNSLSDKRLKRDIHTLENGVNDIMKLRPVDYYMKESHPYNRNMKSSMNAHKTSGFIAQEVEKVFPGLVNTPGNDGIKAVNYIGMIPHMVKAMQEQQDMIEEQAQQIATQKEQIDILMRELRSIKKSMKH